MLKIKTIDDFKKITKYSDCELQNDIDFNNAEIKYLIDDFSGSFNGNGYKLKNIILKKKIGYDGAGVALINTMCDAKIKNLIVENLSFDIENNIYIASIACFCIECEFSTLENVNIQYNNKIGVPFVFQSNRSKYIKVINNNIKETNVNLIRFCYYDTIQDN